MFYKIKYRYYKTEKFCARIFYAPMPKTKKEKAKLFNALKEFKSKTVLPMNINFGEKFAPLKYNCENFIKRVLAESFLEFCKTERPKNILICDDNFLKYEYYLIISNYSESVTVKVKENYENIAEVLLKERGMVPEKIINGKTEYFTLDLTDNINLKAYSKYWFGFISVENLKTKMACNFPENLKNYCPVLLSAIAFYENNDKSYFNLYKNLIINELQNY